MDNECRPKRTAPNGNSINSCLHDDRGGKVRRRKHLPFVRGLESKTGTTVVNALKGVFAELKMMFNVEPPIIRGVAQVTVSGSTLLMYLLF